jgi:hypothetical protein
MSYRVFTRTWWRRNAAWPEGREPGAGRKTTIAARVETETDARAICTRYNASHEPGFLSRKAEYEER